ncbi:MAG: hypothetical protein VX589_14765 [Myxococcota bacterium]|nr:hypothetical protein [Myxococcota bacterium]
MTVKILCESALALATQKNEMGEIGQKGGVLTPASALGTILIERLRSKGFRFEVQDGVSRI